MQPITRRTWQLRGVSPSRDVSRALAHSLNIHELTARVLLLRGIEDPEQGADFLAARLAALPDPDLLPDMQPACQRLVAALEGNERIAVHGDYDVDGITGCTLLVETLRQLGADVEYHIPLRLRDGYGLSAEALQHARDSGCRLVVSVDCGVSALGEAALARELGLDLIITDHHQPPRQLPDCLALINPHLPGTRFPWPELSGVGVAFFLLAGLRRALRQSGYFAEHREPDLRYGLDLVALGTIADLVPLHGVNRTLVRSGLELLEKGRRPGVAALKKVAEVREVTSGAVGFRLAPRLNAAGRLEDAALGVSLLLDEDPAECAALAALLDGFNRERQQLEEQTLVEAIARLEKDDDSMQHSIVLASDGWHPGVIGIVASRLVERYHRPTILVALSDGQGKGSARSIKGFHLFQALQSCAPVLDGFGGHAMAAGLTIAEDAVAELRRTFEETVRKTLAHSPLTPLFEHDGEVFLTTWTAELLRELEGLQPCGVGNPQAVFVSRTCRVRDIRVLAGRHLKFTAEQDGCQLSCIAFGCAQRYAELDGSEAVDLLYRPGINRWRGRETLQLQVLDWQSAAKGHERG